MSWWQALVLGVVEGLTEYLPVSSTGHLILVSWLLGLDQDPALKQAVDTFNIVIQFGAIAAVLGLYRQRCLQMLRGLAGRDAAGRKLATNLLLAFLPAAVLGPLLNDPIKAYLFQPPAVIGALFVGAWLMIAVAANHRLLARERSGLGLDDVTPRVALLVGFGQCIAMWPGTSRSMMTIVAAMLLGMKPRDAAEFSFLLGLVTLSAATGYDALQGGNQMLHAIGGGSVSQGLVVLGVGFLAATVSAALAVEWFVSFLTRHGLAPFGWYRMVLAAALAALYYHPW